MGGDDLTAQPVLGDDIGVFFPQRLGEIPLEVLDQQILVGKVRIQQFVIRRDLGIGEQHRDLGPGKPAFRGGQFAQPFIIGKFLQRPVELAGALEAPHQAGLGIEKIDAAGLGQSQRLGLQVIVPEHQSGDLIRHRRQQRVALLHRQLAILDHGTQQDLDVDLVVRGVDAGGIVDGVGVDPAAGAGEFDASRLGNAKIGALAHDLAAKIPGLDPKGVARPVAGIGVGLEARLDEGADAAEPRQIHLGLEDGPDQFIRRHLGLGNAEELLDLGRQGDRLGLAFEDTAAGGDEVGVVIAP